MKLDSVRVSSAEISLSCQQSKLDRGSCKRSQKGNNCSVKITRTSLASYDTNWDTNLLKVPLMASPREWFHYFQKKNAFWLRYAWESFCSKLIRVTGFRHFSYLHTEHRSQRLNCSFQLQIRQKYQLDRRTFRTVAWGEKKLLAKGRKIGTIIKIP